MIGELVNSGDGDGGEAGLAEGLRDKNSCFREAIFNFRFEWESWEETGMWAVESTGSGSFPERRLWLF